MCTALVEIYQEKYCIEQGTTHHIENAGAATKKKKKLSFFTCQKLSKICREQKIRKFSLR